MAHDLRLHLPTPSDVSALVLDIRPPDLAEIIAKSGPDWVKAIEEAIAISTRCFSAFHKNNLLGIFGVAPYAALAGIGSPWAIGTNACYRAGLSVTKCGQYLIDVTAQEYPHLLNYIDARQIRNIRWLKHLGYTVHEAEPYGLYGKPFHKFELKRKVA